MTDVLGKAIHDHASKIIRDEFLKSRGLGVDQSSLSTDKLFWTQPVCLEVIRADIAEVYAHVTKLQEMETSRGVSYNGIINHNVANHAFNLLLKRYGPWILTNTNAQHAVLLRPHNTETKFRLNYYFIRIEYNGKGAKLEKVEVGFPYEEDMIKFKAQFECV